MFLYMKPQPMKHETPFRTSHIQPRTKQFTNTTSFSHCVFQVVIFRAFRDDITKAAADSFRFAPSCRPGRRMHCECGLLFNRRLPLANFSLDLRSAPLSSLLSHRALPPQDASACLQGVPRARPQIRQRVLLLHARFQPVSAQPSSLQSYLHVLRLRRTLKLLSQVPRSRHSRQRERRNGVSAYV